MLILVCSILLTAAIFLPIWRIELDAPQYPEGLVMQIFSNKLGGDVDIINGLNHYIGMPTLHVENFIEFKILPYLIGLFALLFLITAISLSKKMLYFMFYSFVIFGIISMVDFWRWEYNYGHNLNPNAAIIVPGMSYQPPLIGFKQLLNFGAYSIPDLGGWAMLIGGVLVLIVYLKESRLLNKFIKTKSVSSIIFLFVSLVLLSCSDIEFEPININKDKCDYCKMTISDIRFAGELITKKGRVNKFDDVKCLISFCDENKDIQFKSKLVSDFSTNQLIDLESAYIVTSETLRSPMGGNSASFANKEIAEKNAKSYNSIIKDWNQYNK